ncbi:MAG: glycosyltransferase family 4 protein [Chloroflexi bacterium]|nr:glycosyltransferase family 4 protein [Chloroflexota bacterium]
MRIGIDTHFATSANATGNRTYTTGLVHALTTADNRNEYILYAVQDHPYYQQFRRNPRVKIRYGLSANGLIRNFLSLPRAIARDAPDVVHLHFIMPWCVRTPVVLSVHDLHYLHLNHPTIRERALGALTRWSAQRAAQVVTLSDFSRRDIISLCSAAASRIATIPLAADASFAPATDKAAVAAVRMRLGIKRDYVLFVGRTDDPRKNIESLIDAYITLRRNQVVAEQLVIVGRHGPGTTVLRDKIASAGLQEDVLLPGVALDQEIPALMSGAELFVYPSSFEGFGLPVLEAMACGTPVITSNVTSLPEVAGDAAVMVNPGDSAELAQAMRCVLQDAVLRKELQERGLARSRLFSWERTARETLQVYERIAPVLASQKGIDGLRAKGPH